MLSLLWILCGIIGLCILINDYRDYDFITIDFGTLCCWLVIILFGGGAVLILAILVVLHADEWSIFKWMDKLPLVIPQRKKK